MVQWLLLESNQRDDIGLAGSLVDYLRCSGGESFSWGQSSEEADGIEVVNSGSAACVAGYLADNGYEVSDLSSLVAQRPEFLPVQEGLRALGS